MGWPHAKKLLFPLAVLLSVCAAYANHFQNTFHFDDSHTVVDNPYIRSLHNLPRFFADATTFSVLPANRTYRPVVSASLALDYALGHGYRPFWFHLSTFLLFLLQLAAIHALFMAIFKAIRPQAEAHTVNRNLSLLAVAWYGLHPAMAETVNYIIQRGDLFCALGVVAALALYAQRPALRKSGLYLLPLLFALFSKPPALVFPLLLFFYILLFEPALKRRPVRAALACLPSLAVCALSLGLQAAMTPKTYTPATLSAYAYRITQPFVLMRYFAALFLPIHLNVDTDLQPFATLTPLACLGFLFVALLLGAAWFAVRHKTTQPIAFGLLWFLLASLPTSLYRLSEVENDHRMFLPFVGLILAVVWGVYLALETVARKSSQLWRLAAAAAVLLLLIYGYGTHLRNQVWRSDEALWLDDVQKSPHNGRGLMNYGLTQMAKGAFPVALDYFQRALVYTPNYEYLEINLAIAHGAMQHPQDATLHFQRALNLAPADEQAHFFFGRWLYETGRIAEAVAQLETAVRLNPARLPARDLLATAYLAAGDTALARATATETLRLEPADAAALAVLARPLAQSTDDWINASLFQYQRGNFTAAIAAARKALELKPDSKIAYNNLGAAYAGLAQWDQAIQNERAALRIDPAFTLASNNLALYTRLAAGPAAPNKTPEDWLNSSLRSYQAGQFAQSIDDAKTALRLRPNYAEAYNNLAAGYASLGQWDNAIAAAQKAIQIKPDYQLAKNNLAWAQSQKALGSAKSR